jgi:2',3'-cyclic-nucleotide 2'-phosphodiesterase (5'-nucleotidase family)
MKIHLLSPIILFIVVGLAIIAGFSPAIASEGPVPLSVTILHWNDFHSYNTPTEVRRRDELSGDDLVVRIGGYAALAGFVDSMRSATDRTVVLHAGDDFQGTPISSATLGESQFKILNIIQPDAFALGNHEFDYGADKLLEYVSGAGFPVICANVVNVHNGNYIVPPYIIVEKEGVRIAVIGIMSPDFEILISKDNIDGLTVLDPSQTVRALFPTLKNYDPHLMIALSHMGVDEDKILAGKVPELDLIVGGHSHTPLFSPVIENGVRIVQAGSRGRYIGKVDLSVDTLNNSIVSFSAELIEVFSDSLPRQERVAAVVDSLEGLIDAAFSEVIGILETDWITAHGEESNIGNWQSDVMRQFAETDIAFQNSGGIRRGLTAGPITVRDIWEINPFGNTFVTFTITGKTLKQMVEWQLDGRSERMQVSGLTVQYDPDAPFGEKAKVIRVNGEPLTGDRIYSIVTNNYVAGQIKALLGIEESVQFTDLNVIDRDVFMDAIREQGSVTSYVEGRIASIYESVNEPF